MYVCICSAVTDRDIREATRAGANNLADLGDCLGVATQCGRCASQASAILRDSHEAPASTPTLDSGLVAATA